MLAHSQLLATWLFHLAEEQRKVQGPVLCTKCLGARSSSLSSVWI